MIDLMKMSIYDARKDVPLPLPDGIRENVDLIISHVSNKVRAAFIERKEQIEAQHLKEVARQEAQHLEASIRREAVIQARVMVYIYLLVGSPHNSG